MERSVVKIYKGMDKETTDKVKKVKEETMAKIEKIKEETSAILHEISEEYHDTICKFAGGLSDEEFTALMKSENLGTTDKMLILTAYNECLLDK